MSGICCQRCLKAPCVCDIAAQPPPDNPPSRYKGRCEVHGPYCQYGVREEEADALEAENAALRDERDRAIERHNVAQETIAVLREELAAAQREAEKARARLAEVQRNGELAVGNLLIVARALSLQKCQCRKMNESLERCARCAAMDATTPDVEAFLARVKAEGAAKELRRLAGQVGNQFVGTRRYSTPDLLTRAAELEGA